MGKWKEKMGVRKGNILQIVFLQVFLKNKINRLQCVMLLMSIIFLILNLSTG